MQCILRLHHFLLEDTLQDTRWHSLCKTVTRVDQPYSRPFKNEGAHEQQDDQYWLEIADTCQYLCHDIANSIEMLQMSGYLSRRLPGMSAT